jgi:ribonuclease P protein component
MTQTDASFSKGERLCGIKAVSELFSGGRTVNLPPLRLIYRILPADENLHPLRVMISVPKRHFKRAVDRNLIRRRIKEAWRMNKTPLKEALSQNNRRLEVAVIWNDTVIRNWEETMTAVKEALGRLTRLKY